MTKTIKGFAGLRSLVSEVDETVAEPANRKDQAEKSASRREKLQSSQRATAPVPRSWPPPKTDHNVSKSDSRKYKSSSPLVQWLVGFVGVGWFIWLLISLPILLPGDRLMLSSTYTRGSHEDDVVRLQGTPTKIVSFEALGLEAWHFGRSRVDIDSRTRRVLEWNNDGNLKVRLLPGDRVTSSPVFARGSHEDDVLRLQGTPTAIVRFEALGHESWHFGRSRVEINSRTRQVLDWHNDGNLKVRQ